MTDRTMPHDRAAEQCALGAMLLAPDAIGAIADIISARDLYDPRHEAIFRVVLAMYTANEPTDPVTVAARLTETGLLPKLPGGSAYLFELVSVVPTAANGPYYARIVAQLAKRRRLIEAGTRIAQIGYADEWGDDKATREIAATDALSEATIGTTRSELLPIGIHMPEVLAAMETGARPGTPTGYEDLDRLLLGLHEGEFVVVAGRPGHGKSTVVMDWSRYIARRLLMPVIFFSLEMSRHELIQRLVSAETRIPHHYIRKGGDALDQDSWDRIARCTADFANAPLYVDDQAFSLVEIMSKARRLAAREKPALIVVDYIQLITGAGGGRGRGVRQADSRQEEVSDASRSLKLLGKELGCPVAAVSQLNRGPEHRPDKRPQLSDLRDSGAIEQDCDVAVLVYRPDAYDKESPRAGEVDLIVDKSRHTAKDTITLAAQLHFCRFESLADIGGGFYSNAVRAAA